ncbi:MAG: FlgD immunoglobulin-like domain containing protein [Elusimicrobiota bacterium]
MTFIDPGILQFFRSGGWGVTTVDSAGETGYNPSIALDSNGYPRIAYNDWNLGDLRYASWDGNQWTLETVVADGVVGGTPSLFIDSAGTPHISYYDYDKGDLWYAKKADSGWAFELVDSSGNVGLWSSLKVDSSGKVHIAYEDITLPNSQGGMNLKYAARGPNGGWWSENVDTQGDVGQFASLALDSQGKVHIAYMSYAGSARFFKSNYSPADMRGLLGGRINRIPFPGLFFPSYGLKYARQVCTGGCTSWTWAVETVDTTGWSGFYASLAIDSAGTVHISHQDALGQDLRYATKPSGGSWSKFAVDSAGDVGEYVSMALDPQGNPRIVYYDVTGDTHTATCSEPLPPPEADCHYHRKMKYAKRSGSSWSFSVIWSSITYGDTYWHTSMIVDKDGIPHSAFTDGEKGDLRYTRWSIAPRLSWTGEPNLISDGVDPDQGNPFVQFRFRVKYSDSDGDPALAGYPRLHVRRGTATAVSEISGSPFAMSAYAVSGATASYETGLWLAAGEDYSYYFEAYDRWGVRATGAPTVSRLGPTVADVAMPSEENEIFAYPNPARGDKITFRLTLAQLAPQIDLKIFDVSGALVRSITSDHIAKFSAPVYEYAWDLRDEQGSPVASGMYVYFIHARDQATGKDLKKVKKFAILK